MNHCEEKQTAIEQHRRQPLPDDNFQISNGRGHQQFNRAAALLFREKPHGDHGKEEESDHSDILEQWPDDLLVEVHGIHLAAHLAFHAVLQEATEFCPEEISEDNSPQSQQHIRNRRSEITAQFFPANDPDISHDCSPVAAGTAASSLSFPVS